MQGGQRLFGPAKSEMDLRFPTRRKPPARLVIKSFLRVLEGLPLFHLTKRGQCLEAISALGLRKRLSCLRQCLAEERSIADHPDGTATGEGRNHVFKETYP